MRHTWTKGRCFQGLGFQGSSLSVLAATVTLLQLTGIARAQYLPQGNQPQPQAYGVQQQSYGVQPQSYGVQQQSYSAQPAGQNYAAQQQYPQYTAMATYGNENVAPQPAPAPVPDYSSMPPQAYQGQSAPMMGQGGCSTCGSGCEYNYYNTFDEGCGYGGGCFDQSHCCGSYMMGGCGCGCGPRWFGGVYGLLMERTRCDYQALGFSSPNAAPAYPGDDEIVLYNTQGDIGYQGGFEVRFGMYCGGRGGCGPVGRPYDSCGGATSGDSCGGGSCGAGGCGGCGPTHAWEFGYWGLFEDEGYYAYADATGGDRLHGMVDFRGLQYDPGAGYRPVNVFYDYGPATTDNSAPYDVEVRQLAVRNTFSAQNVEINVMRLPLSCCNSCCGCGPRCEMTAMAGFRLMRLDDDFWLRSDFEGTATPQYLAYNVGADNTLYGAQIGGSGTYRCGCSGRLAFHVGTAVGLYGNHMEVTQSFASTSGNLQYVNNGSAPFLIDASDDDVAVVGELRIGASYMCHCNWRLYGGWRLLGISGVALATDQIPNAFSSPVQDSYVNCGGSIILQGLQTGIEFIY